MRFYNIPPERISVVLPSVDPKFRPNPDAKERLYQLYGLEGDFLLFVGTIKPNKNLPRILDAFAELRRKGFKHQMVIVGQWGWSYEPVKKRLEDPELKSSVLHFGFVPDEHLPLFYSACTAMVSPSLYEGFGLPVLEAMACGAPVITSNVSSLPEVTGDAAILVDPFSVEEISHAMERVLRDEGLRNEMSQKGLERSKKFSWDKVAKETMAVYEKVIRD
jgi:glycosyltransferase involved in cell wall biosynthesis